MRNMERKEWLLFFTYVLIVALITKPFSYGDNEGSRYNTIRAIVETHSLSWNDVLNAYKTGDKIVVDGKIYSDKPPLFALVSAIVYFVLYKFGILLSESQFTVTLVLKIIMNGVTTAILLILFYRETKIILEEKKAFLLALILGFGTLLFSYATSLNNHTMTALFLFWAFTLTLKYWRTKTTNFFLLGLFLGIVAGLDLITGLLFLFVLVLPLLLQNHPTKTAFMLLAIGWLLPMSIYMYANYTIIGNPVLPAYAFPQYFNYEGSWQNSSNLPGFYNHQTLWDLLVYSFHMTFGARGLFSYAPVLLFGLFFLGKSAFQKKEIQNLAVFAGILFVISYFCLYTSNYGGSSYGARYLLPLTPILLYYASPIFAEKKSVRYLFYGAVVLSVVVAFVGALNPWINHYPGWYSISFYINWTMGKTLFYNTVIHYILHFGFGMG